MERWLDMRKTKQCSKCQSVFYADEAFTANAKYADGLDPRCRWCRNNGGKFNENKMPDAEKDERLGPKKTPKPAKVRRRCLSCGASFEAEGKYQRMCLTCRQASGNVMI